MNFKNIQVMALVFVTAAFTVGCNQQNSSIQEDDKEVTVQVPYKSDLLEGIEPTFYYAGSAKRRLDALEKKLVSKYLFDKDYSYYYNYSDLDNDQDNEIIVWLKHSKDGQKSQILILDSSYELIYNIENQSPPVVVLDEKHRGWHDLALYDEKGTYIRVAMSDNGYQLSDNSKENVIEFSDINGIGYLADALRLNGFEIK